MTAVSAATCDRVLEVILAHIERHGRPPLAKQAAYRAGVSHSVVFVALSRPCAESRLPSELRNPRGFFRLRRLEMLRLASCGVSKADIARRYGVRWLNVHRVVKEGA